MSFYCTIKEHLSIKGKRDMSIIDGAYVARSYIEEQLAALAGLMVLEKGYVIDLSLTADGAEYKYEGDEVTPEYKKIISAIEDAEELDLVFHYDFEHRSGQVLCELAEPFRMMDFFEHPGDMDMTGVFYSAWNAADCDSGYGGVSAYGELNGKTYKGRLDFDPVAEVPDGVWNDGFGVMYFEFAKEQKDEAEEILAACREAKDLFGEIRLNSYDGSFEGLEVECNDAVLHGAEDGERLIALIRKAMSYTADDKDFEVCFVDTSSDDVRQMEISVDKSGKAGIIVASV